MSERQVESTAWSEVPHEVKRIVRLRSLETGEDRQEFYRDMLRSAARTGIPLDHWYRKIQTYITALDDAEDIISASLFVGRKIAPKLLLRAVPVVGAALLVKDALDLATMILAVTQPAGLITHGLMRRAKGRQATIWKSTHAGRDAIRRSVSDFINRRTRLGDLLELGQALDTLTGHGIQLGAIMGAMNDAVFSAIRHGQQIGQAFARVEHPVLYE